MPDHSVAPIVQPENPRDAADKITVTITLGRAYVLEQLMHPDDNALAAILRNALYQEARP